MTRVSNYNNNNNNNIKIDVNINPKKVLVASITLVFLLSSTIFNQNQTILLSLLSQHQQEQSSLSFLSSLIPSLAYADKIKIKNKSLINDISDQLVKNNGDNSKDELQNILQQVQMQISLIAGQDKATNAIKEIESVIELNPNGPLAQSLLFLAKQQSTGNIEDVNKVTTDIARNAAAGGDSVVGLLEQSVATTTAATITTPSSSSSSIIPQSSQQQQQEQQLEQQPSQSPPPINTIASFGNSTSSQNVDNNLEQQPSSQSSPSAYSSNDSSSYINTNNATDANTVVSNSSPNSTIKITSVDQPDMSSLSRPQSSPYIASPSSENAIYHVSNSAGNSISSLLVNSGTDVTLNGGSSHDPDGDPIGFKWEQISGPLVTLNGDNASQATFTAPSVHSNTTMLFRLTVTDQDGLSDSKTTQIMVTPTS